MAKAQPDLSSYILASAQRHNVDPALVGSVVQQESSGNPGAINTEGGGKGAYGAMQVRQAALADYNKANGTKYSMQDLLKPDVGVDVGTWYLGQQLNQFNDPVKALIAYTKGAASPEVATGAHPYATQVMSRLSAKPAMLPGVPSTPQASATDDDAILAAFSKGGAATPASAVGGAQSDDAILSAFTKSPAAAPAPKPTPAPQQQAVATPSSEQPGKLESFGAGLGHGFGSIVLGVQQLAGKGLQALGAEKAGNWLVNDANAGLRKLESEVAPYQQANPITTGAGDIGGAVIPSLMAGGGGLIARGAQAGARGAQALGLGALGTRVAQLGGAAAGSGALGAAMSLPTPVSPDAPDYWAEKAKQAEFSTALGMATPIAAAGIGRAANYAGNLVAAPFRPFTEAGRQRIAKDIIRQYSEGGANAAAASPIGRNLTLTEATGNPGIATLQRTIRDLNPNPFVAQEQTGAALRQSALERITGTVDDLAAAQASRSADAADAYLSTHVGIPVSNTDYAALRRTPAFQKAFSEAQNMARNAGSSIETQVQNRALANRGGSVGQPETYVSGQGLHFIKQALDDQINAFAQAGERGKAANVLNVKNRLLSMMDSNIDGYAAARAQFAEASRPIDAMQYLQSKNFTDANGNVTAAKVDQVIKGIAKEQARPGIRPAKSVSDEQLQGLMNLRDDLRLAGNTGLGRSAGSSTAQNLATQQMLQAAIPGRLGALAGQLPSGTIGSAVGGILGWGAGGPGGAALGAMLGNRAGRSLNALMNTQNDAIQGALTNMLLNSPRGLAALQGAAGRPLPLPSYSTLERLAYPAVIGAGVRGNGSQ